MDRPLKIQSPSIDEQLQVIADMNDPNLLQRVKEALKELGS